MAVEVRNYKPGDDLTPIIQIVTEWKREANLSRFHINGEVPQVINFIGKLIEADSGRADLLVLEKNGQAIGFMGIVKFTSPISGEAMAEERFWYVLPEHRNKGLMLLDAVERWARDRGCKHLICTASDLASDLAPKVAAVYARRGFQKYETSYIKRIA